jgi:Collagen triple helix repeat (20 copies)
MRTQSLPVLRRWKTVAGIVGAAALMASSGLAAPSDPATALGFHPTNPSVRVLDTRTGIGAPVGPVAEGATLDLAIVGLPDDASAVTLNVTVVGGTKASHLKVYPKAATQPDTAVLAWSSTITMSTTVVVPLGTGQAVTFFNKNGTVHVIADLVGYHAPGGLGATGPAGANGTNGSNGTNGEEGPMGADGPAGPEGPQGPAGLDGAPGVTPGTVFVNAVNTAAQRVHLNAPVLFPTTGVQGDDGFNFIVVGPDALQAPPLLAGQFKVTTAGVYRVTFSVSAAEASQLDVYVNGGPPTPPAKFGAALGQPNVGTALVSVPNAGIITLVNATSTGGASDDPPADPGDITLPALLGGTGAAINAWITIELVSLTAPI